MIRLGLDVPDTLEKIHVRLDCIRAAVECIHMTAYYAEPPRSPISSATKLIMDDLKTVIYELCELTEVLAS